MRTELLLLAAFLLPALRAWQQPVPLDQVLPRIQANVAQFTASLPDFVCNEKITSSKLSGGNVTKQNVNESTFVGVQKRNERGGLQYQETREVTAVDGKKAGKSQKLKGPFLLTGGFSGILSAAFDAHVAPARNYKLEAAEPLNGKTMLVVAFSTKESQADIGANLGRKGFRQQDTGRIWVDPESMQVARLESLIVNTPGDYPLWFTSVDYARVEIGGKAFWMPKFVRSELRKSSSEQPVKRFEAEYTKYRKFDVSSGIVSN
ncbi:MAG TPA: hypothetical protein VGV35_20415 [Bryobacteraceae bacterium]|nr:hypothetical protein [Bryobacteraceae bacterium]